MIFSTTSERLSKDAPPAALWCPPPPKCFDEKSLTLNLPTDLKLILTLSSL